MEPSDFDKLIKEKLQENHHLHEHDIEASRPYAWSAVQRKLAGSSSLTWYHMTAAVLVLLLTFSGVLFQINKTYRREIQNLSMEFKGLANNQNAYLDQLNLKNNELNDLNSQLISLKFQLDSIKSLAPTPPQLVYRTDTVYLKETIYQAYKIPPISQEEQITLTEDSGRFSQKEPLPIDDVIFISSKQSIANSTQRLKIKFGPTH